MKTTTGRCASVIDVQPPIVTITAFHCSAGSMTVQNEHKHIRIFVYLRPLIERHLFRHFQGDIMEQDVPLFVKESSI